MTLRRTPPRDRRRNLTVTREVARDAQPLVGALWTAFIRRHALIRQRAERGVRVDIDSGEVFADGRQAVMRRIYPSRADSVGVRLFSNGGAAGATTLEAWDMMPSNPF